MSLEGIRKSKRAKAGLMKSPPENDGTSGDNKAPEDEDDSKDNGCPRKSGLTPALLSGTRLPTP